MTGAQVFVDLDGTLCGKSEWRSFASNSCNLFRKLYFRPPSFIKWNILTARPRIDLPLIKLVCVRHRLNPDNIITSPLWRYSFKNKSEIVSWKYRVLTSYLRNNLITNVIYIDDDIDLLRLFPPHRKLELFNIRSAKEFITET